MPPVGSAHARVAGLHVKRSNYPKLQFHFVPAGGIRFFGPIFVPQHEMGDRLHHVRCGAECGGEPR